MLYNIYSTITDSQYVQIEEQLKMMEIQMIKALKDTGFKLTESIENSDALMIDFIKEDEFYYGNIGLRFDDIFNYQTFTMYITKSFDKSGCRFFYREYPLCGLPGKGMF